MIRNRTLARGISLWAATRDVSKRPKLLKHLNTVLKVYVIRSLDPDFNSNGMTSRQWQEYCNQFGIERLNAWTALKIFNDNFDQAVREGQTKESTRANYRAALKHFLKWLAKQSWYEEIIQSEVPFSTPEIVPVAPKEVNRPRCENWQYKLEEEDFPEILKNEMASLQYFWENGSPMEVSKIDTGSLAIQDQEARRAVREARRSQNIDSNGNSIFRIKPEHRPVKATTIIGRKGRISRVFGWCVNIEGYAASELSLDLIIDPYFIEDFCTWLVEARKCHYAEVSLIVEASIAVLKWKYRDQIQGTDYSNIPLYKTFKNMRVVYKARHRDELPLLTSEKWAKKEITHEQARQIVIYFKQWCAEFNQSRRKRPDSAVVASWNRYLFLKFLTYVPIRQEEIRKLVIGKTLIRVTTENGIERYVVRIKEHKNYSRTKKIRYYPLPQILTKDLDMWINTIRAKTIAATATLDSWLEFWGYESDSLEKLHLHLENTQKGILDPNTKNPKQCEKGLKEKIRAVQNRIKTWEAVKARAESCNHVFFCLGKGNTNSSFKPLEESSHTNVTGIVSRAVAKGTKALYGEEKYLNPHGFRHIAAKHLRKNGNGGEKDAFCALVGHGLEVDDEYASQIITDYDLVDTIVDNWWLSGK